MEEVWKNIDFVKGNYSISNLGNVKSLNFNKTGEEGLMKISLDRYGYNYVELSRKKFKIHRLVALMFIPNPENKPTVNHKDEIKTNNEVSNLEWATFSEQNKHSKGISFEIEVEGVPLHFNSLREGSSFLNIDRRKLKKMLGI